MSHEKRSILEDKGYREAIAKLGYGKALGITEVKPIVESPAIRDALDDLRHELRAYVLAVSSR